MRILLVNDDGFYADGLLALARVLADKHEVIISAPAEEQSAKSHALSLFKKIKIERVALPVKNIIEAWKIYGTPVDCVKIYLEGISPFKKPDLVVSGINSGENLGTDVIYSGTLGGAREGFLHGIPSIALSLNIDSVMSYSETAEIFLNILPELLSFGNGTPFLNVNFPQQLRDNRPVIAYTVVGRRDYINACKFFEENGERYCEIAGRMVDDNGVNFDTQAVKKGYISVTPLITDATDYGSLGQWQGIP